MKKQSNEKPVSSGRGKLLVRLAFVGLLIAVIFSLFKFTPLQVSDFTPTKVQHFILQFGAIAPLLFIALYALRGVIVVIPVGVMSLTGGLAFGRWLGTFYILIGATLGSCLSFLVARYVGREFVERMKWLHKGRIRKLDDKIAQNGFQIILFMRLVPLFQYDALNFGAGLSKMRFRDYALGTFLGMIPGAFITANLGDSLDNIVSVQFFIALAVFVLMMFIPKIYGKLQKRFGKKVPFATLSQEQSSSEERS